MSLSCSAPPVPSTPGKLSAGRAVPHARNAEVSRALRVDDAMPSTLANAVRSFLRKVRRTARGRRLWPGRLHLGTPRRARRGRLELQRLVSERDAAVRRALRAERRVQNLEALLRFADTARVTGHDRLEGSVQDRAMLGSGPMRGVGGPHVSRPE